MVKEVKICNVMKKITKLILIWSIVTGPSKIAWFQGKAGWSKETPTCLDPKPAP